MPAAQAVTEGARQIALARNTGQLRFSPDAQGFDLCCAVLLTSSKADIGRLACNVALDVVKRADTVESLARDLGFVRGPDIMEVTSPMRPAGRFPEAAYAVRSWLIKLPVAFVAVSLKDAACLAEVMVDVLFLPVGSKVVDRARWSRARPGTLIADIGPDPALLHALAQTLIPKGTIKHPDWSVIGMKKVTAHDHRLDPLNERLEHLHGATAPIDQRAVRNVGAHAGEDLVQAIQRQVIVELRDQDVSQKDGGIDATVEAKVAPIVQPQLDHCRHARNVLTHQRGAMHGGHVYGNEDRIGRGRQQTLLLQLMPPGVNLLPAYIVPVGNLSDRRTVEPNRHDNVELLLVTPTPPSFLTKNFDTHPIPHLRHVANDVANDVS